jgi:hypothetical protein
LAHYLLSQKFRIGAQKEKNAGLPVLFGFPSDVGYSTIFHGGFVIENDF